MIERYQLDNTAELSNASAELIESLIIHSSIKRFQKGKNGLSFLQKEMYLKELAAKIIAVINSRRYRNSIIIIEILNSYDIFEHAVILKNFEETDVPQVCEQAFVLTVDENVTEYQMIRIDVDNIDPTPILRFKQKPVIYTSTCQVAQTLLIQYQKQLEEIGQSHS